MIKDGRVEIASIAIARAIMRFNEGVLSRLDLVMRHDIEGVSIEDLLMIVVIEIGLVNNRRRDHVLESRVIVNGLG